MTPEIALKRIHAFRERFGQPSLYLAYHAAFPLALTPDLIYRLWGKFQRDSQNQLLNIPWIAVSDLLLSGLCEEVGHHLYEMEPAIRSQLLREAREDDRIGENRLTKLSHFLIEYAQQHLKSNNYQIQDFAQAQYWTALLHAQPSEALKQLAQTLQDLGLDVTDPEDLDAAEVVRMTSLLDALVDASVNDNLRPLLTYARAMSSYVRGNPEEAATELATITTGGKIQITGIDLPIPQPLRNQFTELKSTQGQDFRGKSLRGRSFKGKDLTGANFSGCDIRGSNFTNATLVGADFSKVKTGLQKRWAVELILFTFVLLIIVSITTLGLGVLIWFEVFEFLEKEASFERNLRFSMSLIGPICLLFIYGITFFRGLSSDWVGGGMSYFGNAYFTAGIVTAIVYSSSTMNNAPNYATWSISGLAILSNIILAWRLTHRYKWSWLISCGTGIALITLLSFLFFNTQDNWNLLISLSLLAVVVDLVVLWMCNTYSQNFRQILFIGGFIGFVAALITNITLVSNNWSNLPSFLIVGLLTICAFLAGVIILSPSLVLGTSLSMVGSRWSTLLIASTFVLLIALLWGAGELGLNNYATDILILIISLLSALLAWALSISIAVATVLAWTDAERQWMSLAWTISIVFTPIAVTLVLLLNLTYWLRALMPSNQIDNAFIAGLCGTGLVLLIVGTGLYMAWQATVETSKRNSASQSKKFQIIRQFAVDFLAKGGTQFRGADLTDANFTAAVLKGSNFRKANMTRTNWSQVKKLHLVDSTGSYLQMPQVQQLIANDLVGRRQNFNRLNLQGLNLQGADLNEASFRDTNFREANLRGVNFSGAQLVNTQLENTDLTGVVLTGAFLKNIYITSTTKLRNVECDFIYTNIPTADNPDLGRVPKNERRKFRPGEFKRFLAKFIS